MNELTHIPYYPKPDYTRLLVEISPDARERMFSRLPFVFGEEQAQAHLPELVRALKVHFAHKPQELRDSEKEFRPNGEQ